MDQIAFWNMTWGFLAAQFVGFIGLLMNVVSYQANTNRRIVRIQVFGALFWCLHFLLLGRTIPGAYTGAALNAAGLLRNLIFAMRPRKWAAHPAWLYVFCGVYVVCGALTWNGPMSLLPMAGMLFGTVSLYLINPKLTRRLGLGSSCTWMAYNICTRSAAGIICEVFTLGSIGIAMFKFDRKPREE